MAMTVHVNIVSAENEVFSGQAEFISVSGSAGELGIAPRHTPLLTTLKAGPVKLTFSGDKEESFFVNGGILEVQPHLVTILSDTVERAEDLDEQAAEESKRRAEEMLADASSTEIDYAKVQAELAEAVARLQLIKKLKGVL